MLRHSQARTCTVATRRDGRTIRLEVTNDGVAALADAGSDAGSDSGTGLAGLTERAAALSGTVTANRSGDRFWLVVQVPEDPR